MNKKFLGQHPVVRFLVAAYAVGIAYAAPIAILAEAGLLEGYYRLMLLSWVPLVTALYLWLNNKQLGAKSTGQWIAIVVLISETLLHTVVIPHFGAFSGSNVGVQWPVLIGLAPLYAIMVAYAFGKPIIIARPDRRIWRLAVKLYGVILSLLFVYVLFGVLLVNTNLHGPHSYRWTQALLVLTAVMAVGMYWLWALNKHVGRQVYWRIIVVAVLACQITYSAYIGFGMSSSGIFDQLLGAFLLLATAVIAALPTWLVAFAYAFLPWKTTKPAR